MPMENVIEVRPAAGVCPHFGSANMAMVLREVNGAESWSTECAECGGRADAASKTFPGIARAMAEQWGGDIRQKTGGTA